MKSFKHYITEVSLSKGWAHKSGKMHIWRGIQPYHVQFMVNNLSKFGVKESDVIKIITKRFASWDVPDKKKEVIEYLRGLQSGREDVDHEIEMLVLKKGWCRVSLEENYPFIGGIDLKIMHAVGKHLDKKYPKAFKDIRNLELHIFGTKPAPGMRSSGRSRNIKYIDNAYDWDQWLKKGGDPDRLGAGRTEIGSTMAQFREDEQYIKEVFDKPYEWGVKQRGSLKPTKPYMEGNFKGITYKFFPEGDGYGEVYIYEYDIVGPHTTVIPGSPQKQGRAMEMHFAIDVPDTEGGGEMSGEITGGGNELRIFATVLDIVKKYVKKNKPDLIRVYGEKKLVGYSYVVGSRLKLYEKLVKRFAPKLGYTYGGKQYDTDVGGGKQKVMHLYRKGFKP